MGDLTWKPLGEVVVGDQVIAVDEEPPRAHGVSGYAARQWKIATVTATYRHVRPVYRLETEMGELVATGDHRLLVAHRHGSTGVRRQWQRVDGLVYGSQRKSKLVHTGIFPWATATSHEAGWLAGFLDGEGHVYGSQSERIKQAGRVGFSQNEGAVLQRAEAAVESFGFEMRRKFKQRSYKGRPKRCAVRVIAGDLPTAMRFLGTLRPTRLLSDFKKILLRENGRPSTRGLPSGRLLRKTKLGSTEVVDITTTAGSFVANGFVVHNCGASGRMLDVALKKAGLMRSQAHITNAMACRTDDERPETKLAATSCCAPRLAAELEEAGRYFVGVESHPHKPQPILALGAWSLRAVLGVNGIQKARGFFWETGEVSEKKLADAHKSLKKLLASNRGKPSAVTLKRAEKRERSVWLLEARAKLAGRWVIPTVHPAFILRGADGWLPVFYNDVKRFKRLLDAEDVYACLEDDAPYKAAGTAEQVTRLVGKLRGVLAVDVETTGPSPLLDRLLCIGISDGVRTVEVFPWNKRLLAKALRQAFSGRTLVMHNGPQFDQIVLRREGVL
jgi:uracil-DNA glycosylase family 4